MNRKKLKRVFGFMSLILILLSFIGFVEKQVQLKTYKGLEVDLESVSGLYFVEENDILRLIQSAFPELDTGLPIEEIPLKEMEERLLAHSFIKSAEASVGQKGIVKLSIRQHEPIARIARPNGADGYITKEGLLIPTSSTYTSRVLILEGNYAEQLINEGNLESMPELLPLIQFITQDEFWKAQITELELDNRDDIRIHQQVGKQVIEFGDARDFVSKFRRIEVLYKEILPRKGWNAYKRISVKFKNQIVCE